MDVANEKTFTKRLLDFQDYYQETAKPFRWKFTVTDLKNRLDDLHNFSLVWLYPNNFWNCHLTAEYRSALAVRDILQSQAEKNELDDFWND